MARALPDRVRERARALCEYCRLPQASEALPFEIDHIIPRQHGGATSLENLALACSWCNKHKGPNLAGIDPETRRITRLFHPRKDRWKKHFAWEGPVLLGLTGIGRATIMVLALNDPDLLVVRATLIDEGRIPSNPPSP